MSTPYQGNPAATESPSPAPGPGVLPTVSLPVDGDPDAGATFQQGYRVCADFIGHVQTAVRLDVPVQAQFGTGFTTPVNNALGGTIQPLGTAHTADGTRFVVQIQTGGAVGAATFKTSIDGGNTFGALQTTAASMTDATSGITLTFGGTFTANGTASFRSGFTPQAQWLDSAGNRRGFIDHLGYRRGRVNEYYENWLYLGPTQISGANSNVTGPLNWSIPAAATIGPGSVNNSHGGLSLGGTNVANTTTSRAYTAFGIASTASFSSIAVEFEVTLTTTANDVKIGLYKSPSTATGTPNNANEEFALCAQATDTNWQLLMNAAGSGGVTKIDTGVAKTTNLTRVTLEWHGTATPYGAGTSLLFINDVLVANGQGANSPFLSGIGLAALAVLATTTNATNSLTLFVSPVRVISNRYASIPAI